MAWPRVAPREEEEEFWEEEKHRKKNKITLPICPSLPLCVLSGLQEVGKAQTALFLEQEKEKTKG